MRPPDIRINEDRSIVSIDMNGRLSNEDGKPIQEQSYEFKYPFQGEAPDYLAAAFVQVLDAKLINAKSQQDLMLIMATLKGAMNEYQHDINKNRILRKNPIHAEIRLEEKYKKYEKIEIQNRLGQLGYLDRPERKARTERLAELLLEDLNKERSALLKERIGHHRDKSIQTQLIRLEEDLAWLEKLFTHYLMYPPENKKSTLSGSLFKPITTLEKVQTVQKISDFVAKCIEDKNHLMEINFKEFDKASGIDELKDCIDKLGNLKHMQSRILNYIFHATNPDYQDQFLDMIDQPTWNEIQAYLSPEEQKTFIQLSAHEAFFLNNKVFDPDHRAQLTQWIQRELKDLQENVTPDAVNEKTNTILARLDALDQFWKEKAEFSEDNKFKAKYALLYSLLEPDEKVMDWKTQGDLNFEAIPNQEINESNREDDDTHTESETLRR